VFAGQHRTSSFSRGYTRWYRRDSWSAPGATLDIKGTFDILPWTEDPALVPRRRAHAISTLSGSEATSAPKIGDMKILDYLFPDSEAEIERMHQRSLERARMRDEEYERERRHERYLALLAAQERERARQFEEEAPLRERLRLQAEYQQEFRRITDQLRRK